MGCRFKCGDGKGAGAFCQHLVYTFIALFIKHHIQWKIFWRSNKPGGYFANKLLFDIFARKA